jgi:hypothetical protein
MSGAGFGGKIVDRPTNGREAVLGSRRRERRANGAFTVGADDAERDVAAGRELEQLARPAEPPRALGARVLVAVQRRQRLRADAVGMRARRVGRKRVVERREETERRRCGA